MLVSYKDHVSSIYEANPGPFMAYELENDLVNGLVHYTSDDGTRAISYNDCDTWAIGLSTDR